LQLENYFYSMLRNNTETFKEFYTSNYRRAFMLVKRYVHDDLAAEDIVSEAMIKLWKVMQESDLDSVEAMLFTMLHNDSLNYLKHKQAEAQVLEDMASIYLRELDLRISTLEDCTPDLTKLNEINNILQISLSQLPSLTRQIFEMSRYGNLTNKEIAKECNISVKAVEYHITKALKTLRIQLKDYLPLNLWPIILLFF
jgi:RNA polymerase sigma-70 factor (ECF subfamily)